MLGLCVAARADVFGTAVDPLFPVTGLSFSGEVATFKSSFNTEVYSATIDWGDGSASTSGTVSSPTGSGPYVRSVSGTHTYGQTGTYMVTVTVTDPHGNTQSDTNKAIVTDCFCVSRLPMFGSTVDIGLVSGQVSVKVPGAAARAGVAKAHGSASGFVPLTQPREIPVGSVLDTSRGSVVVMAATAVSGQLDAGEFDGGVIKVLQSPSNVGLTTVRLTHRPKRSSVCGRSGQSANVHTARRLSKKVIRLLHSSAHGQFRTQGSYSAATVRGTEWTTIDRCDGTLTSVTRGTVVVHDLHRHKNVTVNAGQSYLAKAH